MSEDDRRLLLRRVLFFAERAGEIVCGVSIVDLFYIFWGSGVSISVRIFLTLMLVGFILFCVANYCRDLLYEYVKRDEARRQ